MELTLNFPESIIRMVNIIPTIKLLFRKKILNPMWKASLVKRCVINHTPLYIIMNKQAFKKNNLFHAILIFMNSACKVLAECQLSGHKM